ncbi:MAG: TIGR04438 family Trp-rich protein [Proteobacteria bacterium]|nr:TIGR04438 family Trp-rich protein [Pseudomonadota bacterium]
MLFVAVGALLVVLKLMEIDPVAAWSWWWILAPFAAALAWWIYADTTGLTQRRAIRRLEERKVARRERDMAALGLKLHSDRRKRATKEAAEDARERARNRKGER